MTPSPTSFRIFVDFGFEPGPQYLDYLAKEDIHPMAISISVGSLYGQDKKGNIVWAVPGWEEHGGLFVPRAVASRYVNIVMARLDARCPRPVFEQFATANVPNVAITRRLSDGGTADQIDGPLVRQLREYDFVYVPTEQDVAWFGKAGLSVWLVEPELRWPTVDLGVWLRQLRDKETFVPVYRSSVH